MKKLYLLALALLCLSFRTAAQEIDFDLAWAERYDFHSSLPYDQNVPQPSEFLGYELGTQFTFYADALRYFKALAESSPRVSLSSYGYSHEGRQLIYLVITSEGNQGNIGTLRQNNLKLTDPVNTPKAEAEALMGSQPVVVSFSYNIHGNEASCTEAAMQVAYRLAAAQDSETEAMLGKVVFVMYPTINPDGRDRYVYWYRSMQRELVALDPADVAHAEPWPQGRTNHYWFDLNRDWIWGVHPESRGHTDIYQQWMPQVHTDYHEQGYNANYFTMPGTTPRNLLLPNGYEDFTDLFGRANIDALNTQNISYFTRESFDFFYPSYGSSYPSIMGAIGMLTEQGGIGAGRAITTNDGYPLRLRQRVWDHYTTSVATLEAAAANREALLRYTYEANDPANSKSSTQAYILPDNGNPYHQRLLEILMHHGVAVEQSKGSFTVRDALDYRTGKASAKTFPEGTWVVRTGQSRHLFINSLLSREMAIEDSVMYDMATWSAPLAYNLECYSTQRPIAGNVERVGVLGPYAEKVESPTRLEAPYAWVIDWRQKNAPAALSRLWQYGVRVRAAGKAFTHQGRTYGPGTLIILNGRQNGNFATPHDGATVNREFMREFTIKAQVEAEEIYTGRMDTGIDLASNSAVPLKPIKAAMLVGQPFSTYTSGQLWYLFDQASSMPITRIKAERLMQTDLPKLGSRYGYANLNDYDVLVLPGGRNLNAVFGEKGLEALKAWVQAGGTLVATEGTANFFTKESSGFTEVALTTQPPANEEEVGALRYEDRENFYGWRRIPGTALNGELDTSHPLAFGMDPNLYVLKFGTSALKPGTALQMVGRYTANPANLKVAGYISQENQQNLAGQGFAGVVPKGRGKVVLLPENTQYRMFWLGPSRLMQNAVMLMPSF